MKLKTRLSEIDIKFYKSKSKLYVFNILLKKFNINMLSLIIRKIKFYYFLLIHGKS